MADDALKLVDGLNGFFTELGAEELKVALGNGTKLQIMQRTKDIAEVNICEVSV